MTDDFQPLPPQRAKAGGGWKWLAIGCGGAALLLMVLLGVGAFFVTRNMGISTDPQQVEAKAKALFNYSIPGGSKGYLTMNIFGVELIQVTSLDTPPTVMLTVGTLPPAFQADATREEFLQGFQESYAGASNQSVTFTAQRTESRMLCDQPVTITIQDGEAVAFGESISIPAVSYTAAVDHNDKTLFTWILATGDRATETADSVFRSLECQ